jgi:hypothetical protein
VALLTVSINDPGLNRKSAELAFAMYALAEVEKEFGRGNGTVTSGTILGVNGAGVANTALGTWTYTPSATLP